MPATRTTARKTTARKAPARKAPARSRTTRGNGDVTRALDALNDASGRAQTAVKAIRTDLGRSSLRADLVKNVEQLVRDLRRDTGKLDRAVRADLRKAMSGDGAGARRTTAKRKPATRKATARKPAARKTTARKPAARRTAARA